MIPMLCLFFIALIPLAAAGLALIGSGLSRSRNAAHAMTSALCLFAVAAFVYFFCGFAWQGFAGRPAHVISIAGKPWDWIAGEPLFFRGLAFDGSPASLAAWFGMLAAGLAALVPLGSGAERWRLGAACFSTVLLAGWTYPVFAHWVWGGGWLAQLGANYGLGHGFIDAGGSATIQATGGLTALALAWILGPRLGKYGYEGQPMAIPGHNAVLVLFGCMLAWVGWLGLNSAGALLFAAAEPGRIVLISVNTTLAAAGSGLAAAVLTRLRFGKPDASLIANGWIGGLVASSAGCAVFAPVAAAATGVVAGSLVTFGVEWLELRLGVDDPGGAISVQALGGIWGVLAAGLFHSGAPGQMLAQLVGAATLLGFVLPMTYGLNWAIDRVYPQRAPREGERQGLDLYELGAGAYPDFLTHTEDFMKR